jgi:hypothetical protein
VQGEAHDLEALARAELPEVSASEPEAEAGSDDPEHDG